LRRRYCDHSEKERDIDCEVRVKSLVKGASQNHTIHVLCSDVADSDLVVEIAGQSYDWSQNSPLRPGRIEQKCHRMTSVSHPCRRKELTAIQQSRVLTPALLQLGTEVQQLLVDRFYWSQFLKIEIWFEDFDQRDD